MKILYNIDNYAIYAVGHSIERGFFNDNREKYKVMNAEGRVKLYVMRAPYMDVAELPELEVPDNFELDFHKYLYKAGSLINNPLGGMSESEMIIELNDKITQLSIQHDEDTNEIRRLNGELSDLRESQDNQDSVLSALIELI